MTHLNFTSIIRTTFVFSVALALSSPLLIGCAEGNKRVLIKGGKKFSNKDSSQRKLGKDEEKNIEIKPKLAVKTLTSNDDLNDLFNLSFDDKSKDQSKDINDGTYQLIEVSQTISPVNSGEIASVKVNDKTNQQLQSMTVEYSVSTDDKGEHEIKEEGSKSNVTSKNIKTLKKLTNRVIALPTSFLKKGKKIVFSSPLITQLSQVTDVKDKKKLSVKLVEEAKMNADLFAPTTDISKLNSLVDDEFQSDIGFGKTTIITFTNKKTKKIVSTLKNFVQLQ